MIIAAKMAVPKNVYGKPYIQALKINSAISTKLNIEKCHNTQNIFHQQVLNNKTSCFVLFKLYLTNDNRYEHIYIRIILIFN